MYCGEQERVGSGVGSSQDFHDRKRYQRNTWQQSDQSDTAPERGVSISIPFPLRDWTKRQVEKATMCHTLRSLGLCGLNSRLSQEKGSDLELDTRWIF